MYSIFKMEVANNTSQFEIYSRIDYSKIKILNKHSRKCKTSTYIKHKWQCQLYNFTFITHEPKPSDKTENSQNKKFKTFL